MHKKLLLALIVTPVLIGMQQGSSLTPSAEPSAPEAGKTSTAIKSQNIPSLQNLTAHSIAEKIWLQEPGIALQQPEDIQRLTIPEHLKPLIFSELDILIREKSLLWETQKETLKIQQKPSWLRLKFFKNLPPEQKKNPVNIKLFVGGFSIKDLCIAGLIPAKVPDNGTLDLSETAINNIAGLRDIKNLSDATTIRLNGNQLTTLPEGAFADLPNLETLILTHNSLQRLPETLFAGSDNLAILWIDHTVEIPAKLIDELLSLKKLTISDLYFGTKNIEKIAKYQQSQESLPESLPKKHWWQREK